jgi:hypothetical protein
MLKDGWCTLQFNAFLQDKQGTQTIKGGNTAEFYAKEGTLPKSKMLYDMHPDITVLTWKYGRQHHYIDYRHHFSKNKLVRCEGITLSNENKEYGMLKRSRNLREGKG